MEIAISSGSMASDVEPAGPRRAGRRSGGTCLCPRRLRLEAAANLLGQRDDLRRNKAGDVAGDLCNIDLAGSAKAEAVHPGSTTPLGRFWTAS